MWNKAKCILLANNQTQFGAYLVLNKESKLCIWNTNTMGSQKSLNVQHLYIINDDVIKEGDYYMDFKSDGNKVEHFKTKEDWVLVGICDSKKIIATTDKSLGITDYRISPVPNFCDFPQIPQSFIEQYITEYNVGNIIVDVLIEYEQDYLEWKNSDKEKLSECLKLKINQDNTINIKTVKDIYSRQEMIEFGLKCVDLGMDLNNNPLPRLNEQSGKQFYYNWVKDIL